MEEADRYTALPAPGWLLHGTRHDGIVRLYNHGSDHHPPEPADATDDPHYAKLAYSTHTAPLSAPHAVARTVDNHLALVAADGTPGRRTRIHPVAVGERRARSWYAARLPGNATAYRVDTTSLLHGPWEVRVHRLEAPAGVTVREGGHPVAGDLRPDAETGPHWALARRADGLTSAVVALYGWQTAEVARDVEASALGPHAAVPLLRSAPAPAAAACTCPWWCSPATGRIRRHCARRCPSPWRRPRARPTRRRRAAGTAPA
ncbi:hypothetical protein ACFQ1B_34255 [Streptomyces mexicanus]